MDAFCEQVVSRKNGAKQHIAAGILVALFVIPELIFILLFIVAPSAFWIILNLMIGLAAAFILTKALPRIYKVEFDYSVVGNNLYIDKVINKRKRKTFVKVEINNVTLFDVVTKDNVPNEKYAKAFECVESGYEGNHFLVYHESGKGKCLLFFTPNEKIINGMRPYMTREVVMKYFYKK